MRTPGEAHPARPRRAVNRQARSDEGEPGAHSRQRAAPGRGKAPARRPHPRRPLDQGGRGRRGVAPATAHRRISRWRGAADEERTSRRRVADRSSRPDHQPGRGAHGLGQRIPEARARTDLGPARLSHIVGAPPSTVWTVPRRHGRSRGACTPRPVTKRCERAGAGALIHIDTAKPAGFDRPGHRTRGRSTETRGRTDRGLAHAVVHVAVDDHSRHACVAQHADEKGDTCARSPGRAPRHFTGPGPAPAAAVMTDSARGYGGPTISRQTRRAHGATGLLTPPHAPRWNGKAAGFIPAMKREWAYAHQRPRPHARTRAPGPWVRAYGRRRHPSSPGSRPPIGRAHTACGKDGQAGAVQVGDVAVREVDHCLAGSSMACAQGSWMTGQRSSTCS
ncbi:MAG: DDE-type integrase/transposase/recombinase [Actinobacteria bacterium]|nr:DDE-type integrase/transposase/recombinase [Actinomycetota bacterium]